MWERYRFQKKRGGTHYAKLFFASVGISGSRRALRCVRCAKHRRIIFLARLAPVQIPQKTRRDTLRQICVFAFQKKCVGTHYAELLFCIRWDPWVTYCIAVRPGCETSMHYFSCSGGTGTDSRKCASRHVLPNLCFCIRWDMRVT
jgi:hypothetical protein